MQRFSHKTIWAITGLIAAMAFAAFATTTVLDNAETEDLQDTAERQGEDITANEQAIADIAATLDGVTVLVEYVEDLKAAQEAEGNDADLSIFVDLLCASEDPVRLEACRQLPPDLFEE